MGHMFVTKTPGVAAQQPQHYLAATPQNLEYIGLGFTQISFADSRAQGAITKDQAIAVASNQGPELKLANGVSAVLGFLHNAGLQRAAEQGVSVNPQLADMGLVWLVTFHGVESFPRSPRAIRYVSSEYNVVIDAKTGRYIMAFPLYDVTPSVSTNVLAPTISGPTNQATQLPTNATPTLAPTFVP